MLHLFLVILLFNLLLLSFSNIDNYNVKRKHVVDILNNDQKHYLSNIFNVDNNTNFISKKDLQGGYYSLNNLLINEKYKFVFCPIQKSSTTKFKQLFLKMSNDSFWFDSDPYHKSNSLLKPYKLGINKLEKNIQR